MITTRWTAHWVVCTAGSLTVVVFIHWNRWKIIEHFQVSTREQWPRQLFLFVCNWQKQLKSETKISNKMRKKATKKNKSHASFSEKKKICHDDGTTNVRSRFQVDVVLADAHVICLSLFSSFVYYRNHSIIFSLIFFFFLLFIATAFESAVSFSRPSNSWCVVALHRIVYTLSSSQ